MREYRYLVYTIYGSDRLVCTRIRLHESIRRAVDSLPPDVTSRIHDTRGLNVQDARNRARPWVLNRRTY